MARLHSFAPIVSESARTLILGTMPGTASLRAQQYYAHPRNAFWGILAELLDFDPCLEYPRRVRHLVDAGIAVWDVLRSCERHGSLDARITPTSIVANDFGRFFARHQQISKVCFNGAAAEVFYRRHVLPGLACARTMRYVRLPSTSPANASIPVPEKARIWRREVLHNDTARGVI